jgi:hypothetical protein
MSLFFSYNTNVEKAYIIRIKNNTVSEELANRCFESCIKVNMPCDFWDAYDGQGESIIFPDHHNEIMKLIKITNHYLSKQEIACFMSHISLWTRCCLIDKPVVILEHDSIMVNPYLDHKLFNSIAYLGCTEQNNGWGVYPTPPHGTDGPNNHFILRAHAYAIDPAVSKNLLSHVIKNGIYTTADKAIRADLFPIHQIGFFAYDKEGKTTIQKREEHDIGAKRMDNLKINSIS